VRVVVDYRRPLRFDERFEVEVHPGRIGRSSIAFHAAILVPGETEPRATGELVWVHADQATMRLCPRHCSRDLAQGKRTALDVRSPVRPSGRASEFLVVGASFR